MTIARLAVIAGFWAVSAAATPSGLAPMGALLRSADAVVVVTVASVSGTGATPLMSGVVLRTIKGSLASGAELRIAAHGPSNSSPSPRLEGRTCLWFLRQAGPSWLALPVQTGNLSAQMNCIGVPGTAPQLAGKVTATPDDALAVELLSALGTDDTAAAAEEVLTLAMSDVQSTQLTAILPALAASSEVRMRRTALSMLLRRSTAQTAPLLAASDFPGDIRGLLTQSVCQFRSSHADDVKALGRLSQAPFPDAVRGCATYSLRGTHSATALPLLAALLDDSNADIRYDALIGIASYALNMPAATTAPALPMPGPGASSEDLKNYPSRDTFARNEQPYLTYWKARLAR